jgi:hypothetical protein
LTVLVLAALACSMFGQAEEAVDAGRDAVTKASEMATAVGEADDGTVASEEPTEGPVTETPTTLEGEEDATAEPATEQTGSDDPPQPELDSDALTGLVSYRTRLTVEWEPEEGETEAMRFEDAHTREPSARRLVMSGMDAHEAVELVQIEDRAWMCTQDACSQMEADPEELASGFSEAALLDPGDLVGDADATFVGREEVNGIQTRHYTLDLTAEQVAFLAQGEVSDLEGEVWVADEPELPSFAARYEMSWTERRQEVPGEVSFVYETYDVNEPFAIAPPEGAADTGLPEDVPLYPDAQELFSVQGMVTFRSSDDATEVAEFYRERLSEEGWSADSDDEMGDAIQQMWVKDGRTLAVFLSDEEDGSTAMLTLEE